MQEPGVGRHLELAFVSHAGVGGQPLPAATTVRVHVRVLHRILDAA